MRNKILIGAIMTLFGIVLTPLLVETKSPILDYIVSPKVYAQEVEVDCLELDFRYIVLLEAQYTPRSQYVEVFLDPTAFSEENLSLLFRHLAKNYSETRKLGVTVLTDWNQIPPPAICPPAGLSDTSNKKEEFEYHKASYFRNGNSEYFTFNPVLRTEKLKKVILKE